MIYQGKVGYPVREVVLHTTATPGNWHEGKTAQEMIDEVRRWHIQGNGWADVGYHRLIAPDGSMAIGRSLWTVGAHVKERNRGTIGVVMVPVKTHNGIKTFDEYFTEAQRISVLRYIEELQKLTEIKRVSGHNDYAPKECPGFWVKTEDWLNKEIQDVHNN